MNKPTVMQILSSIDYGHHGIDVIEEYRNDDNNLNSNQSSVSRILHSACKADNLIKHLDDVLLHCQIDHIDYNIKEDRWKIYVVFYTDGVTGKGDKR